MERCSHAYSAPCMVNAVTSVCVHDISLNHITKLFVGLNMNTVWH